MASKRKFSFEFEDGKESRGEVRQPLAATLDYLDHSHSLRLTDAQLRYEEETDSYYVFVPGDTSIPDGVTCIGIELLDGRWILKERRK